MDRDNFQLKEGKDRLIWGISKATDIIRGTYGAGGGNVVLEENVSPFHSVRNDGKAIMDKVKFANPIENVGANILREVGDKMDKDSGDGRKTTMLLTEAILRESQNVKGLPMDIKRSLDDCLPVILKSLDKQKKAITINQVKSVASISSESEELGKTIQEIYKKIGKEGIIEVDHSNLPETYYEITEGVRLRNAGFFGAYSTNDNEGIKATFKNPRILITKDKITSVDQIEPLLGALKKENVNELVIYCEDIDMSVASRLALTHLQGGFKTLLVKSPILWKNWLFEDLAKITGATVVDSKEGKTFKNLTLEDLGTCQKIITTKDETRVIGIKDISDHITQLNELALTDEQQRVRVQWLQTKVATLKVGAGSESELSYVSKKAKDACAAAYLALKDGVIPGGGIALFDIASKLPKTTGGKILSVALLAPHNQIKINMGKADVERLPFGDSIVDPALVVKNSIRNAISIAGTVLTSVGVITLPRENEQKNQFNGIM